MNTPTTGCTHTRTELTDKNFMYEYQNYKAHHSLSRDATNNKRSRSCVTTHHGSTCAATHRLMVQL